MERKKNHVYMLFTDSIFYILCNMQMKLVQKRKNNQC